MLEIFWEKKQVSVHSRTAIDFLGHQDYSLAILVNYVRGTS